MALANEILIGRFSGILHKLLSMKEGAPSPQLSPEIMPVLSLEADRSEWEFLAGGRLGMVAASQSSSAAAKLQQVKIANPAGSNALVVIQALEVWNSARASVFDLRTGCTDTAPTTGTTLPRDLRQGLTGSLVCTIASEEVAAATGSVGYRLGVPQNVQQAYPFEIVLGPGTAIYVLMVTASAGAGELTRVQAAIRERVLEPSETR